MATGQIHKITIFSVRRELQITIKIVTYDQNIVYYRYPQQEIVTSARKS